MFDTKEERHEIYKESLRRYEEEIEERFNAFNLSGICSMLFKSVDALRGVSELEMTLGDLENWFPEFMAHKPKGKVIQSYWWDIENYEHRIKVLKDCIKKTK